MQLPRLLLCSSTSGTEKGPRGWWLRPAGGGPVLWPMTVIKPKLLLLFLRGVLNLSRPQRDYSSPCRALASRKRKISALRPPSAHTSALLLHGVKAILYRAGGCLQGPRATRGHRLGCQPPPQPLGGRSPRCAQGQPPPGCPSTAQPHALLQDVRGTSRENPASWGGAK